MLQKGRTSKDRFRGEGSCVWIREGQEVGRGKYASEQSNPREWSRYQCRY